MNTNTDNNQQTDTLPAGNKISPLLSPVEIMALVVVGKLALECQLVRDNIEHGGLEALRGAIEDGIVDALAGVDMTELDRIASDARARSWARR